MNTPAEPGPGPAAAVPAAPARPLRGDADAVTAFLWGATCVACVVAAWFCATAGEAEGRFISPATLPSPAETLREAPRVFGERKLAANTVRTLSRVGLGFGLTAAVGVPLGVLAACFPAVRAFLAPLAIFGRNVPVAALIPLTFFLFGIGEFQKVMFLFIASVAFVVSDTTSAVLEVPQRYVDTALTLGASRAQIILKVLLPLAAPAIFNSLRLLFGLAFGYVMLAELVKFGTDSGGLGDLINTSQRRGEREPILIVLVVIPLVAYAIDRALWWLQCDLFPHRYGGRGLLPRLWRGLWHGFGGPREASREEAA
ncbi:MAG: Bicarbonate transport system permease protein CmpB [Planctomycetota bacterium]|jgi:ABC-type nitrate/sulfonate/bicarbonate transport system permease component